MDGLIEKNIIYYVKLLESFYWNAPTDDYTFTLEVLTFLADFFQKYENREEKISKSFINSLFGFFKNNETNKEIEENLQYAREKLC